MSPAQRLRQHLAYGFMGLPLAFVALPIYVHLPKLYADFGLSLAAIGAVLLAARLWDALIDPLIGQWGDRQGARWRSILLGLPLLVLGFFGLVQPPAGWVGPGWLLAMLWLLYLGYSLASVNHQAWGAELAESVHERTRIVAMREAFALVGVLLAAALPGLIAPSLAEGLARLGWLFVLALALAAVLLRRLPQVPAQAHGGGLRAGLAIFGGGLFRRLLLMFAVSGIAAAIPASLLLFFVADVLKAEAWSGAFLAIYFIAGAGGLLLWVHLARRVGKLRAWGASMALAVLVFVWAATLGAGDSLAFALICALSGLALGADLCLPPSLLADVIAREQRAGAGSYFGWWSLVAKLNLALAAGLALPLLALLGYVPGSQVADGLLALAWIYAGVPALLKLVALALLWWQRHSLETPL